MKTRLKKVTALLLFAALLGYSQGVNVKVGQKVSDLNITDYILNVPKDKNFSGKFKVIDFWATWCGPCLGAVPHLNDLQEQYKDNKNIVFLSISDEKPQKIQQTLKKVTFASYVVSDQSKKTHQEYIMKEGSYSIPQAFLVDNQNIVRWIGHPQKINKELLDKFLKGEPLAPPATPVAEKDTKSQPSSSTTAANEPPAYTKMAYALYNDEKIPYLAVFTDNVTESDTKAASYWDFGKAKAMFFDWDVQALFALINKQPKYKIKVPESLAGKKYNLLYKNLNYGKERPENVQEIKSFLMNQLNLKESNVNEDTDVYLLKVADANKLKTYENDSSDRQSHSGDSGDFIAFDNLKLKEVSSGISNHFKIIIIDETNTDKKYHFLFKKSKIEVLLKELHDYGLTLEKAKRKVDFIQYDLK